MAATNIHAALLAHIRATWRLLLPLSLCASFVLVDQAFVRLHWPVGAFVFIGIPFSLVGGFVLGIVATLVVTLWNNRGNRP